MWRVPRRAWDLMAQRGTRQERSGRRRFGGRWWGGSTENQKNDASVKLAYKIPAQSASQATCRVQADGKAVALATVVDAEGYLVTKASLIENADKLTCRLAAGDEMDVTLVSINENYDLALLKAEGQSLTPPSWREAPATPGTFVAAIDPDGDVIGLGVISTELRSVPGVRRPNPRRGWLGVTLGDGEAGRGITSVMSRSAASRAGLRAGDLVLSIDGVEMKSMEQIVRTIGGHSPGDTISLQVTRGGEDLELSATLGKPDQADPQDQWGGGPFSERRDDFPEVITHDAVVPPNQCGGPLIDTEGNVVGVNIAQCAAWPRTRYRERKSRAWWRR